MTGPALRHPNATRLLNVPGLHDSGPAHWQTWQTWLQGLHSAALRVARVDPAKFGVAEQLALLQVPVVSTVVAGDTDPWMQADQARRWVLAVSQSLARERRPAAASIQAWHFAT